MREFETLKGTFEYLPDKQILRERIKQILQSTFIKYGFAPVETPIVCMYDLLSSKYSEGADILEELYTLSDRGKRKLGLRYDLTVAFCKLISSNKSIALPFKRYEIGKVFRDGPVRTGRNREFTQCDVDLVGTKSMLAEAEYMQMISEAYRNLDLDIVIKFNNRKLLSGIISCVKSDMAEEDIKRCIMIIDKFAKLPEKELKEQFSDCGLSDEQYAKLRILLSSDFKGLCDSLSSCTQLSGAGKEGIKEISELYSFMEGAPAIECMEFAPYLARGIDIYTGTVWEVYLRDGIVRSGSEAIDFTHTSIGGGGRYDSIITSFIDDGNEYPAVGMTFGLDVIYEILKRRSVQKENSFIDLFIIPMDTEKESFILASNLRLLGVKVEIEKVKRKVKKSMEFANKSGVPYVCVLGKDECEKNSVNVKDMDSGVQQSFGLFDYEGLKQFIVRQADLH
ncbi:MAG: histidine--tRNA ligase [Clostridiales bacterium]|nr:histidine--tRNA ligase [Clostridiales bacterium]